MELPQVGDRFEGRFEIRGVLGEGGFATVYRAIDEAGRDVALKILAPEGGRYSSEVRSRFDREVRVLGSLRDPHTVTMFTFGTSESGLLYMVFEFVPGRDLSQVLAEEQRLEPRVVAHIVEQVLHSLREAHGAGLLHRDIKPENIRVYAYMDDPWRAKLLDFGIARSVSTSEPAITKAGQLVGTLRYMAPEQLTDQELGPYSDLYSLGLVMLEMLVGPNALQGHGLSDQFDRLRSGHVFAVPDLGGDAVGLARILERMSARDPAQRYRSVDAVLRALSALRSEPVVSPPRPRPEGASDEEPTQPASTPGRTILIGAVFTLLAAAIAIPTVSILTHDDAPPPRVVPPRSVLTAPEPSTPAPPTVDLGTTVDAADGGTVDAADAGTPDAGPTRAPGCGRPPPFTGLGQLAVDGLRSLTAYVPRHYDPNRALPRVLMFRQEGQTPEQFVAGSGFEKIADREQLIILAPEGSSLPWRLQADVRDALELVAEASARLCVDESRTYVIGHGAGGIAAEFLSCEPGVTGIATNSYRPGANWFLCEPTRPVPYLNIGVTKGTRMPIEGGPACGGVVKISLAQHEQLWRKRNHCGSNRKKYLEESEGSCFRWTCAKAAFESCHLDGGHGWPGTIAAELDPLGCDPPPADFPYAETIWTFFDSLSD